MKAVFGMTDTTTTPVNKRKNLGRIIDQQQRQQQTKAKQQWFDVQVSIERTRHHHQEQQHGSSRRGRRVVAQQTRARAPDDRSGNDESNHDLNSSTDGVLPISNSQRNHDDDNESIDSTSSVIHVSSSEHNFYDDDDDDKRKQDSNPGDEDVSVDRIMNNDDYDSDDSTTTSSTTPFMNCLLCVDQQNNKKELSSLPQILSFSPSKKFSSSLSTSSSVNGDDGGGGGAIISIARKNLNQQRRMFDDYNRSKTLEGTKNSTVLPPPLPTPCSFDLPSSTTSGDLIPVETNNDDDDPSKDTKSLIAPEHRKKSRTFDECDGEDILRSTTTIKKNRNDATPLIKNTNRYYGDEEEEEQQCQSCHSASTTGASRRRMNGGDANNTSSNSIISNSNSSSVNSLLNILEQDDQRSKTGNLNNDDTQTTSLRQRREHPDNELMKFHLTMLDELHVIPCQCALSLMGMRGTTLLFASPESSTASFGGTNNNNNYDNTPLPGLAEGGTLQSQSSGITNSFMGWLFSSSSSSKKQEDDSLTRTVSGHHHHYYLNNGANASNKNKNNDKKDNELTNLRKRNNKQPALFEIDHTDQYPSTMSINALHRTTPSISKKLHKRSFSNTFVSVQYHEIVLFNMSSSSLEDCGGGGNDDESTTAWNTITIRCEDHDTMDEIVRTLKRASNCKVIPFSTNSRLEEARQLASQQRKQHRRQQRQRQQQQQQHHEEQIRRRKQQQQSTPTSTIDGQLQPKCYIPSSLPSKKRDSEYSSERLKDDQLRTDLLLPQVGMSVSEDTPISEEENDHFSLEDSTIHSKEMDGEGSTFLPSIAFTTPVRRLSLLSTSSSRRDRRPVVLPSKLGAAAAGSNKKNWNMAEECEFCGLHFTLLSRRHHCRKCSCSCCEDCSIVVFLSAKEETRLCNRCNSKELVLNTPQRIPNTATGRVRQGTALRSGSTTSYTDARGRSQRKQHRKFSDSMTLCLLGKVHEGCSTYGVAVMGMLPHWKHYFHFDKRPAVGRITVEIVEALSLKRIDLNLKCNPYVRATITGYDYDLEHNLVEWQQQFTLMTSYCSSTLSPVWRGPGKMGGQLLTLPVLSTCGAVLRLEVLHFDQITNAAGVDSVIGIVEIPLSDLPNANLRNKDSIINNNTGARRSSSSTTYAEDGFVDRWYHLEEPLPPLQVPPSSTTNPSSSTTTAALSGIFEPDASRDRILSSATSHRMSAYLAKPVSNPLVQPQQQQNSIKKQTAASATTTSAPNQTMEEGFKSNPVVKKWLRTMDEVNQWGENVIKVPMEWIGAALVGLDPSNKSKTKPNPLTSMTANANSTTKATSANTTIGISTATTDANAIPSSSHSRKLDSSSSNNKRRSVIHVRIKLNVSESGDLMSHSWFPPMIRPYPKRPTFDPNTTYRRILFILQKADPYIKLLKFCEKCLKWKKPTKTCFQFYFIMVFHVLWFHQLIYLLHIYLIGYLSYRFHGMLQQQQRQRQAKRPLDDFASSTDGNTIDDSMLQQQYNKGSAVAAETNTSRCYMDGSRSSFTSNLDDDISLRSSSTTASRSGTQQLPSRRDAVSGGTTVQETSDDSSLTNNNAGLNKIIVWAAKKWLSSRGMDSFQYKLGLLASNVTKLNTTWDGSDSRVTVGTLVILTTSFVLHILCNVRHLWILFITIGYFGPSPLLQKIIRFMIGFYKGCLKVLRRRHLHVLEQQQHQVH